VIEFSTTLTKRKYAWTAWLAEKEKRRGQPQFDANGDYTLVYFYDGPEVHQCFIWPGEVPSDVIASEGYSQAQSDADKAAFDALSSAWNQSIVQRLPDGRVRQSSEKSTLSRVTLFTHDWTDPTTWYTTAATVLAEVAVDSGDHFTYGLAHVMVIDTYHGKISQEHFLKDGAALSFRVAVRVNAVAKTEQNPHFGTGGDYTVNYELGKIIFLVALAPTDVVEVDYHYMTSSRYILPPTPGKNLRLETAEVQFSLDVEMTDSVYFQPYGLVDYFAPQLVAGGFVPTGTKIPLGDPFIYKKMSDFQNDAMRSYPPYPALGGSNWRAMPPLVIFNWDYAASTLLLSAAGMEIHVFLEHDTPFGGAFATATFYCISEDS